ncbi:hypothetical protein ACV1D8_11005, partial [Aeromonas caviae]
LKWRRNGLNRLIQGIYGRKDRLKLKLSQPRRISPLIRTFPKSSQRLYKIAYTIAALVRNAKRKTKADMRCAISEWESDLSWLRDKYYVDMMWDWPST